MKATLTAMLSVGNTQHVHPRVTSKAVSPLTNEPSFFICHVPSLVATPPEQVSTVWSDQYHRGLRTSQSHRMIYHHHARQGLALSRTLLRVR